jgi:hypothetical protein
LTGITTFTNYEAFIVALGSAWDDPDAVATAERKLLNLKQGTEPCSVYHAKFSSLMAILKWDTPAQVSHFKRGLRDELKDLLCKHSACPIEKTQKLDRSACMYESFIERIELL